MTQQIVLALFSLSALLVSRNDSPVPAQVTKLTASEQIGEISGYYTCKGRETSGKNYSGICVITKQNDVYLVQWVVGAGSTFVGIGIRQGDTLAASWAIPGDKGVVRGVNLYKIEPGPRLVGRWASMPGPGRLQDEILTYLKPLDPEDDE
jgi:hypothetical protein